MNFLKKLLSRTAAVPQQDLLPESHTQQLRDTDREMQALIETVLKERKKASGAPDADA